MFFFRKLIKSGCDFHPKVIDMAEYTIEFDEATCIGCGACVSLCESNWEMVDMKAKPKKTTISEAELEGNKQAEEICPVNCIKIKEK
jgi:ferredoxin